ncbi:MAG: hypothetical protein M1836_007756 [Candelina mexicana]|nr:MAG: hypothetical protein M1836_007756 [Candelina mexicana]
MAIDSGSAIRQASYDTSFIPSLRSKMAMPSADQKTIFLPTEIILQILSYLPRNRSSQPILNSCCLVSRQWYSAAIPQLYAHPRISGNNFTKFVATVCPSVNAHVRKSELAELVRILDMGNLVHDGSKSLTARLLGRMKGGLEEFVAPQASFAVNCFPALSKCSKLRHLDLSLISESVTLVDFFHAMKSLSRLISLRFPRSANLERGFKNNSYTWPPNLEKLYIAGGISNDFLVNIRNIPSTLFSLTIEHCPRVFLGQIRSLLSQVGPQLRHLKVGRNINRSTDVNPQQDLNGLLGICPKLLSLSIAVDYCDNNEFLDYDYGSQAPHPLEYLEAEMSHGASILPDSFIATVLSERILLGQLPCLRRFRFSNMLIWYDDKPEADDALNTLADLIDDAEANDEEGERRNGLAWYSPSAPGGVAYGGNPPAGVWKFKSEYNGH